MAREDLLAYAAAVVGLYMLHRTAQKVVDLTYHNHGPAALDLPRNSDGELIHTLDGIGGWY